MTELLILIVIVTVLNVLILAGNVVILGLAVKMYSEVTKTHIFTKKPGAGL